MFRLVSVRSGLAGARLEPDRVPLSLLTPEDRIELSNRQFSLCLCPLNPVWFCLILAEHVCRSLLCFSGS